MYDKSFFFYICKYVGQFLCSYVLVTKLQQWKINNYETHTQSRLVYLRFQDSVIKMT